MALENNLEPHFQTPIQKFYAEQNVLITGGTGFLGKLLIEKLLRSCPNISSIYILIRKKKDKNPYDRLDSLFDNVLFDRLKKEQPKYRHKITIITGDCSLPGLGISPTDKELILREISIVFNVAATVRFDEKLRHAVNVNVNSTKEIMNLCRNIQNLKAVIHVSTAYSNCTHKNIEEKFYEPPLTGDNAIKLVQSLDDKKLDLITQTLLGNFPNTYAFTKCIAEQVVQQHGKNLPAGIFRPAIIISTYREPVSGWVGNIFGPTGAVVGAGAGLIRTLYINEDCAAELVPADLTVNALIATAWDVANNKNEEADPIIYNYHASWSNKITWGEYTRLSHKYGLQNPTIHSIWYYTITYTKNLYLYYILSILLHIIPAFFMDMGLFMMRKEMRMLKAYKKIHRYFDSISYFSIQNWNFNNANTSTLWNKLHSEDQSIFYFSMRDFNWHDFMEKCIHGLRAYVFKDEPENLPIARKRMARLRILHEIMKYTSIAITLWVIYCSYSFIQSIDTNIGFSIRSIN